MEQVVHFADSIMQQGDDYFVPSVLFSANVKVVLLWVLFITFLFHLVLGTIIVYINPFLNVVY